MSRFLRFARHYGPAEALRHLYANGLHLISPDLRRRYLDRRDRAAERRFDEEFGTDTAGVRPGDEIDAGYTDPEHAAEANAYVHTYPDDLLHMLGAAPFGPEGATLVDYGSGKGRSLLIAAALPWRAIVGIEFARAFHEAAVRNLAVYPRERMRCTDVRSELADATEFTLPAGPVVCYAYDPFDAGVFAGMLARLRASYEADPRPLAFLYLSPRFEDQLASSGFLRLVHAEDHLRQGRFCVYATADPAPVGS